MLCERCQSNEATVHFSALAWPSGELTKHLCESCYPQDEALRTAAYGSKPNPTPVSHAQNFFFEEHSTSAKPFANSADAAVYGWLSAELKRFPANRERLATEILTRALEALEKGNDAWELIGFGTCFAIWAARAGSSEFVDLLEKIFRRSIELMAQSKKPPADHPFGVGLTMVAKALRRADPARFVTVLECLKAEYKGDHPARPVLDYLERRESEKWGRPKGEKGERRKEKGSGP